MSYYNTTELVGEELKESRHKGMCQRDRILAIFDLYHQPFSPSQVVGLMERCGQKILLTSARRAIADLTNEGALIKTDMLVTSPYGAKEYLWRINDERQAA